MKALGSDIKLGLLGHFLAALIFLIFLEPIASALSRIVLAAPAWLFKSYQDRLYAEIATGEPNYGFFAFVLILFLIMAGGSSALLATHRKKPLDLPSEVASDSNESNGFKGARFVHRVLPIIGAILIQLVALGLFIEGNIRLSTVTSFHQYVTILTPRISEQERTELLANFASMRRKEDYFKLIAHTKALAAREGIALPPNKLYPILWE